MRWTMQPTRATTRSQHASRVIAALQLIVITFVMHAMLGRRSSQLKMPRPDAYPFPVLWHYEIMKVNDLKIYGH